MAAPFLKDSSFIPTVPRSLHPFFHSATGKADVMAGILATILDHEDNDKDNTLEMVSWLQEAHVPEDLKGQNSIPDLDTRSETVKRERNQLCLRLNHSRSQPD